MPSDERTCAECGGSMVAGVIIDYRRGTAHHGEWVAGRPNVGHWTGKVKNDLRYEVTAYRCADCGLLKLYAASPASAPGDVYG